VRGRYHWREAKSFEHRLYRLEHDLRIAGSSTPVSGTEIRETRGATRRDDKMVAITRYAWVLESPMSAEAGNPTSRLWALIELIRPAGERLKRREYS
jgi:hypothetical protein